MKGGKGLTEPPQGIAVESVVAGRMQEKKIIIPRKTINRDEIAIANARAIAEPLRRRILPELSPMRR